MRKLCLIVTILLIILLGWAILGFFSPRKYEIVPDVKTPPKMAESVVLKQTDPLSDWIDKLATYESCPPEGILDTNGRRSYGPFCYQLDTFVWFIKYFRKEGVDLAPNSEDVELTNLVADPQIQKRLTRLVFKWIPNAYEHWYTSIVVRRGLGMPPLD